MILRCTVSGMPCSRQQVSSRTIFSRMNEGSLFMDGNLLQLAKIVNHFNGGITRIVHFDILCYLDPERRNCSMGDDVVIEVCGDIWEHAGEGMIAVTTSGSVTRKGKAVMTRGVAGQAARRFPELPETLGLLLRSSGNHVHLLGNGIVSFPVEASAWEWPDLRLISRSARELRILADREGWQLVLVPRPGCGGGGLDWREVRPLLDEHFDARFVVMAAPNLPHPDPNP